MKNIFVSILFLLVSFTANSQQSYIIPDIGTPGMTIYYEIVGVFDQNGKYGADEFYLNNSGDALRVLPVNLLDTNKVTFGPIAVSWNGRTISGQIFINPNQNPNSWDWSLLNNQFKIPIQIIKDGTTLADENHTFYIVQPFAFGDRSADAESVLGQGNLGKRSPRGAMLVDEMILGGKTYTVSKNDCDPNTTGNQGYLPFVLLSKGDIKGIANSKISVSAVGRNGGPGGGGGGGRFVDYNFSSNGTSGGDGFTGGGRGGANSSSKSYELPGFGSGQQYKLNFNGQHISGYSLNGVPGAICNDGAYESSGGGTGHPFGKSGIASWSPCNECEGEFGGGSGNSNSSKGGSGGFATSAQKESGSSANNGGKEHGNRYGVPLAGGSGGGGGNPQGIDAKAGYGGGGGGAIRVFAMNIKDVTIEADGANGETGDPDGGAGSGGYVEISVKGNVTNVAASSARGSNRAGYGRFRFDSRNDFPSIVPPNNDQSQSISTIATEEFEYVEKIFKLFVKKNTNEILDYYIKPETGKWFKAFTFPDKPQTTKQFDIDLSAYTDTLFYGMAVQSTEYTGSEEPYKQVPKKLLSQAAGNIFRIAAIDLYCVQPREMELSTCNESVVYDTVWVQNKGNILTAQMFIEDHVWDNGNNGFELFRPTVKGPINEKDSMRFIVKYTHQTGQSGMISNTLTIPYGKDISNATDEFKIEYKVDVSNLSVFWYRQDGNLIEDTLHVDLCLNESFTERIALSNNSNIDFTITEMDYRNKVNTDFTNLVYTNDIVKAGERREIQVGYNQATPSTGTFTNTIYFKVAECNDIVDSLVIVFNVKEALLELTDGNSFIDFGKVNIVLTNQKKITIINNGNAPAYIENPPVLIPPYEYIGSNKAFPLLLKPGEELEIDVKFSPTNEGAQIGSLKFILSDSFNGCNQTSTFELRGEGVESNLEFYSEIDWKSVQSCHSRPDSTINIKNNSNFNVKINGSHTITGVNPENWEISNNIPTNGNVIGKDGGILSFDIRYKADIGVDGPKSAILKIPTDDVSLPTESDPNKHLIIIQLKAYKEGLEITVVPNPLIDFGNSPINSESIRIALDVTNDSKVLTRTLNQIKPAEFRMYNGVNQTFAPGETKKIEVTVKLSQVGLYESDFELVFDTFGSNNCPATYTMQAKAFGIKGETTINPTDIDFGILNRCTSGESRTFTLENVGDVPITLSELALGGLDSPYFTIAPYTKNDDIAISEIKNYSVLFSQIDGTYGTFTANVAVGMIENNNSTTYNIPVTAVVSKGVLANPIELDFGQVVSTLSYNLDVDLENMHNWNIALEDMQQITSNPTFSYNEASLDGKTIIGKETVNVMFTPPSVGLFEDTLKVPYLIDGTCQDTILVIIKGEGMPASEITIFIPDQVIDPTLAYVELPIMAQITNGLTAVPKFQIQDFAITMDRYTFHPKNLSKGRINNITYPNNDEFTLNISIDDVEVTQELKQISSLYAVPLLGNKEFSTIILNDLKVDKSGIFSNIIYQPASVQLIICKADGDRLLKNNQLIELKVAELNNTFSISGSIIEAGYNQIDIISIDGKTLFTENWIREIGGVNEFDFNLNINQLSTGLYIVRLTTPNDVLTQKIIINK